MEGDATTRDRLGSNKRFDFAIIAFSLYVFVSEIFLSKPGLDNGGSEEESIRESLKFFVCITTRDLKGPSK